MSLSSNQSDQQELIKPFMIRPLTINSGISQRANADNGTKMIQPLCLNERRSESNSAATHIAPEQTQPAADNNARMIVPLYIDEHRNSTQKHTTEAAEMAHISAEQGRPLIADERPHPIALSPITDAKPLQPAPVLAESQHPEESTSAIVETPDGLFLVSSDGKHNDRICNFSVRPCRSIKDVFLDHTALRVELTLYIDGVEQSSRVCIPAESMDNIVAIIQKRHPGCWVSSVVPKAAARIVEHIRQRYKQIPMYTCFRHVGWRLINGQHIYLHDGLAGKLGEFAQVQTGYALVSQNVTQKESCAGAYYALRLSSDSTKVIPLFLFAHLALLWSAFKDAGHAPQFLLFVTGPSGALKTAVCKVLFTFFNTNTPQSPASFKDTSAALEAKMDAAIDSVLLVDDYHPATTSLERNNLRFTLERIVRFYGDSIGRDRCTANMELQPSLEPHGMCVLTGEDTDGTESTLLRCLIIEVTKGTFDADALTVLQDNPVLWSTYLSGFVSYVSNNYDQLLNLIKTSFPILRKRYSQTLKNASRLIDAAAYLSITAELVIDYFRFSDPQSAVITDSTLADWERAIISALSASRSLSTCSSPSLLFSSALTQMLSSGQLIIAADRAAFLRSQGTYAGYTEKEKMWLIPEHVYTAVCRYWQSLGKPVKVSQSAMNKDLASKGLIETQRENRSNGETKLYYTVKSSFGNRARFLVVDPIIMDQLLADT